MAFGQRCSQCALNWPVSNKYRLCPCCKTATSRMGNLDVLSSDEALSLLRHAQFDDYYAQHCHQRNVSVDGPLEDNLETLWTTS